MGACARRISAGSIGTKGNQPCHRSIRPCCLAQAFPASMPNPYQASKLAVVVGHEHEHEHAHDEDGHEHEEASAHEAERLARKRIALAQIRQYGDAVLRMAAGEVEAALRVAGSACVVGEPGAVSVSASWGIACSVGLALEPGRARCRPLTITRSLAFTPDSIARSSPNSAPSLTG